MIASMVLLVAVVAMCKKSVNQTWEEEKNNAIVETDPHEEDLNDCDIQ